MSRGKILAVWAVITALTVILALILGACGKQRGQVAQLTLTPAAQQEQDRSEQTGDASDGGVLPGVMALDGCIDASRGVSEDETVTSQGLDAYINDQTGTNGTSGLNVETEGTALTLRAYATGEYAYAVYGQDIGADPKPLKTLIDCDPCAFGGGQDDDIPLSYYVGIADYSIGSWRWFGPFGEVDVMITVNSETLKSRFKSPGDNFYLCVLASNGSKAASALPDEGLIADFPFEASVRAVSDEDDDPGGLTIEEICTWVEENLLTDPAIVTGLEATTDTEGVNLTWDTNLDPDVYIYQVFRDDLDDDEPPVLLAGINAPEVTYSDATGIPGKEYQYAVRARNNAGFGGRTLVNAARELAAPSVSASDDILDYIEIEWTTVESAVGYRLYRSETDVEGDAEFLAEVGAETLSYLDAEPPIAAVRWYWVQALGEDKDGPLGGPDNGVRGEIPNILSVSPTDGLAGTEVSFSAEVSGAPPFTYAWDFGGGATPNTSTEESPTVTLGSLGSYFASLTVANAYSEDTYDFTLNIFGAPLVSSVSPTSGLPGSVAQFTANVTGSEPFTYAWDFGGGATPNTSTAESPTVSLGAEGNYAASVTVTNDYGEDTFEFMLTVLELVEMATWPEVEFSVGDSRQPYLYFAPENPKIRRNPCGHPTAEEPPQFEPDDTVAFDDIIRADGEEFMIVYGTIGPPLIPDSPMVYYLWGTTPPGTIGEADGEMPITYRQPHLLAGLIAVVVGTGDISFGLFTQHGTYLGGVTRTLVGIPIMRNDVVIDGTCDFGVRPWGADGSETIPDFSDKIADQGDNDVVVFTFYNLWLRHNDNPTLPNTQRGTHLILTVDGGGALPDILLRPHIFDAEAQGGLVYFALDISADDFWFSGFTQEISPDTYNVTLYNPGAGSGVTYPDNLIVVP